MSRDDAPESPLPRDGLTRRELLQAGSMAGFALALPGPRLGDRWGLQRREEARCILLVLVGGPSQLDTWDPKPEAPAEIQGPFRPIATRVPGVHVSECFPRLARVMDQVALVRSCNHRATPVHDAGHQLIQTGRLVPRGVAPPHVGCVLAHLKGPLGGAPAHVLLPGPIGDTGGNMAHGQDAGWLGASLDPVTPGGDPVAAGARRQPGGAVLQATDLSAEPAAIRDRYGRTRFGDHCLRARRLVERGVQFVTVNMYQTVLGEITWDCHGAAPFGPIASYRDEVGPTFDRAYSALIEDLARVGLLASTMVVASGEFGRTPRINATGGRDHHPGCWTALFAGGLIRGGTVVGASDAIGLTPKDRPVSPAEMVATIYEGLGVPLDATIPGPDGLPLTVVEPGVRPISELF